ncbi:MAG TPA: DUF192 domain-containing protein [Gemmatimonadales bacterium]|jgi:uncharacterized membrane protein (UPF0127 family)|nr:DUF192 domain-containing protein [Gemmatimonadales bacterium]
MRPAFTVTNVTRGRCVAARVWLADRWWSRLRGLLGRSPLREGEGLMLMPCKAVHMLGMRYPIDVVFLDRQGGVVATYHRLEPGARSHWHRQAALALELRAGTLQHTETRTGDALQWCPTPEAA